MPTDASPPSPLPARPHADTVALRRQLWFSALFLAWGAFELGRWTEAADPGSFFDIVRACGGTLMAVASIFGLRLGLRQLTERPSADEPAR
jgi:hypothetical protein